MGTAVYLLAAYGIACLVTGALALDTLWRRRQARREIDRLERLLEERAKDDAA